MAGDYTRFTFDPLKAFSGVRKQQGRVSLDADFNEFEAILDRRGRAQMYDTVGSVGRAVVPKTTPEGFKIGLSGGQLSIGIGRAYVDGILAECFGDLRAGTPTLRDDILGGIRGATALPFDRQPFYYTGFPFPSAVLSPGRINTVYLDVWQREVTVCEDERLREPALNGPDTATRVQTAWQVKVLSDAATSSNCAATPPGWGAVTAPSTARLTASTDPMPLPPAGPCDINPSGGYTGLENRLYRVEVHASGTLGGATRATFKWSRDNASLAARVTAMTGAGTRWTLTVSSTGPDAWTRFSTGDHLELLDDDIELAMRERGTGGWMATVVSADHTNETIEVDGSLSGFTVRPERHPRIRRWDRPELSSTEPLVRDVSAGTPLTIEHGIKITFNGAAGDTLRAGDYWVFEARTADGSIGRVVDAPPHGPLHHFAKLAYVTSGQPPTDCRVFWPPDFGGGGGVTEGCCTVVVKPGEDIQAAIGKLAGKGGCVCLKMGVHTIPQPLQIAQDNVTLHAEAPLVTVRLDSGGPQMLSIQGASQVSVMGIRFIAKDGAKGGAMIELNEVEGGRIAECAFGFSDDAPESGSGAVAIRMDQCAGYAIEHNSFDRFAAVMVGESCDGIRILGNRLTGPSRQIGDERWSGGVRGISFTESSGIDVEHNRIDDYRRAIQIGELSAGAKPLELETVQAGCRIVANVVTRRGGSPFDGFGGSGNPGSIAFAIAVRMPRCEIVENAVQLAVNADGGILADCGNLLIARNLLGSTAKMAAGAGALVVARGVYAGVRQQDALTCVIRENLFTGLQQPIFVTGTSRNAGPIRGVDIASNQIEGSTELAKLVRGVVGSVGTSPAGMLALLQWLAAIVVTEATSARVADNDIAMALCGVTAADATDVVIEGNRFNACIAGIVVHDVEACDLADNAINQSLAGVLTLAARATTIRRNTMTSAALGIVDLASTDLRIHDNVLWGGVSGIDLLATSRGELRGNAVERASTAGIMALPLDALTLAHNTTRGCGYRESSTQTDVATGIAVMPLKAADVLIESCQALDTGMPEAQKPGAAATPAFKGKCLGITVNSLLGPARTRVHGCTITSPSIAKTDGGPGAHVESRALLIKGGEPKKPGRAPGGGKDDDSPVKSRDGDGSEVFADAADNLAEQTATHVVEIITEGEITFSANRCRLLDPDGGKSPVVSLAGDVITVTGNRVRASGGGRSLRLMASRALAAVGNATTTDAEIIGVPELPAPYRHFNART